MPPETVMTVPTAGQIRAARAALGWSQEKLGWETNIHKITIAGYERDDRSENMRLGNVRAIVEAFTKAGIVFVQIDGHPAVVIGQPPPKVKPAIPQQPGKKA